MLLALWIAACSPEPMPLPAQAAAEEKLDRQALPPLYRKLYDYAFLPDVQASEQRVRLLVWLRYMEFNRFQLGLLGEIAARVERERVEVEAAQAALVGQHEPAVKAVYEELWAAMMAGATEEELARIGEGLDAVRLREADLLALRSRSVRTLFELEAPFLQTLTPQQEAKLADATFLLRHRLDPYANPGDFNALIGSLYYAGEFGVLSKSTFDPNEDHLDIGGLWSAPEDDRTQARFPDARREVVLYLVLLEPTLPEALDAATKLRQLSGVAEAAAPGQPVAPVPAPPGAPGAPGPGSPESPAGAGAGVVPVPGTPPPPGIPTPPPPAPPGAP